MPSTSTRRMVSARRDLPGCRVVLGCLARRTASGCSSRFLTCVTLVTALSLLSGCYSHYGYQGQPGGGPGYYGQPNYGQPMYQGPGYPGGPMLNGPQGQPLGNGGTYTPGVTTPGSSPTPLGNPPSTYDNSGPSIRFENPNNNAPEFNATPGTGRGAVPEPGDDLNNSSPGATKPSLTPTTSATQPDDLTTPFGESSNTGNGNSGGVGSGARVQPANGTTETDEDPFFEMPTQPRPLGTSATSGASPIQRVSYEEPQLAKLNPFGRDLKHANPTWLRGVIDYDPKQKTWSILYSSNPDSRDPNGGCLTLANHPGLAKCRLGEVVLAEGAIDATQTDARGKPLYVLDNITPLKAQ